MKELDPKYAAALSSIKDKIQSSPHLQSYLDEEEEAHYDLLKQEIEPLIEEIHLQVAENDPLQLELLEEELVDPAFEGLFLPRILGYSVLRGAINDQYKYIRPQEHFKKILLSICNSFNFDILKNRIGQTIEVGFSLSSDIWITNLIAEIDNKLVKTYLQSHKLSKYTDVRSRHTSHFRYSKQFKSFNFLTATLPQTASEVKIEFNSIVNFLLFRATLGSKPGDSVYQYLDGIIGNEQLGKSKENLQLLLIIGLFFDLKKEEQKKLITGLNKYKEKEDELLCFEVLRRMQESNHDLNDADYARLNDIVQRTDLAQFKIFMNAVDQIDKIGYINSDAVDTARTYHNSNKGLSPQNECLRNVIFRKFKTFMSALAEEDFIEYFELNKVFTTYMNSFDNEKFNQNVKGISMTYVKKLLRKFTEKRSKDYQDIKKFVSSVFLDLGFMKEKEIKELFKTKRKKVVAS